MTLLRNIRYKIHDWLLKRKVQRQTLERYFNDLGTAKNIGILYLINELNTIDVIRDWKTKMEKQGKSVTTLGYVDDKKLKKKLGDYGQFHFFTNQETNWLFIPKSKKADRFMQTEFDLLLNVYIRPCKPLQYISALSKANLRVGVYTNASTLTYNDFLVDLRENAKITELIKQIEHYLKPKNSNTYA